MVQVRGCSGALLSPHTAMTAAHCWGTEVTGCGNPYEPEQSATAGAELTGKYVYVPPVGSFEFGHPNTAEYGIAAFRTMPSWTTPFGTTCCPNGPVGCDEFCGDGSGGAPSAFEMGTKAHKHHDITMVYVERPIEDVTPDKIILETNGTLPASMGGYDFDPVDLEGTTAVIAGASWSTQSPSSYTRVYGPREIQTVETPGGLSPVIVVDSELDCDENAPTTEDYDGVGATLFFNPATTGEACTRGGDSGGPTYLNAPNLGGDDLTALFGSGAGRLIGGNHSAGQYLVGEEEEPTHTCADIGTSRDTTTWNLLYEHEGEIVLGQNGDFIRKAMEDFDLDGWVNDEDNCPYTRQENQANCNEIAEVAKGFPERGDACDPIPCAHGRIQPAKLTNVQTQGGSLIQVVTGTMTRDQFEVEAVPSHHYFSGASNGELLEPLTVDEVPTLYRYCKNDDALGVLCTLNSTVDSDFADLPDGIIGAERPFLRAHVKQPTVLEPVYTEEEFDYGSSAKKKLEWKFASDNATWLSNQWVSGGHLSGRLWLHSDTTVGQYAAGSPTGYRVNESGTTAGEDDLPNHYVPLVPQSVYNQTWIGAWNPWPYFPWKDDWGVYGPAWDGLMEEASTIIKGHEGKLARITRGAKAVVIEDHLTTGLKTLMGQTVLWEPAAEANLGQAHRGPTKSPHAIAFKADGTDVADGAWQIGALRGTTSDASEPSLLKSGGPSARTSFSTVYSRADDLAFVVGGLSGSTPTREIWFRSVEGDIPWTSIPLGLHTSYEPQHVRAATWSFREQMLWVLDHDGAGTARLARVHPFTGFASVVHEWDWTGEWNKHWMQLAPNGDVVLFATSTEHTDHAAARFSVPPMVARAKVTVTSLFVANNELLYRPTIDPRGYSRIVLSSGRISVLRSESIGGSAADLADLQAML